MFDKDAIIKNVHILCDSRSVPYEDDVVSIEVDNAIEFGARARNCSVEELESEKRNYTSTLVRMVMSALQLYDKLGMTTVSQNGVMNIYEDGNIYQAQDVKVFVPLMRGI